MNRPLDPLLRLTYFVFGTPVPQGSKRAWYNQTTKQVMMTEDAGARHSSWRWELSSQARQAMSDAGYVAPFDQPILCALIFQQHRPGSHYGSGKYSQRVRPSAPRHPGRMPDLDKLVRAVFDSLTSIVWIDDAQVVRLTAMKKYIDRWEEEGVAIHVSTYEA